MSTRSPHAGILPYQDITRLISSHVIDASPAIEDVLGKQPCDLVISDQFADPAGLRRALMEKGKKVQLVSMVRAESDLAVAAASVLARAGFLERLKKLGETSGYDLPKGAGPGVDQTAAKIIREKGEGALRDVAKLHFKTVEKARAIAERS